MGSPGIKPGSVRAAFTTPSRQLVVAATQYRTQQATGAKAAQQRALLAATATAVLRRCGKDAGSQTRERQALKPNLTGARHLGQEQALTAKQGGLDLAHVLNVEIDLTGVGHHTAGVDHQGLARLEVTAHHGAACMHKGQAIAFQFLHDETLTTKEAGAQFLW